MAITVDPTTSCQTMDGFGASITDSSANVLYRLSPADREQTLRKLFDPKQGIGVSPAAAGRFVGLHRRGRALHVRRRTGRPDRLRPDALQHRARPEQVLPLLKQAKQLNPALKVMATPWSPPG